VLPIVNLWGPEDGNTLLRARNGDKSIADHSTTALLAGGQVWKETLDGLRLPASMFLAEGSQYTADLPYVLTVAEWKEQNLNTLCPLCDNEGKTGCQLVDATTFVGLAEHPLLKEDTPARFYRVDKHKYDLWPMDGSKKISIMKHE
jgi:hypothetical protein